MLEKVLFVRSFCFNSLPEDLYDYDIVLLLTDKNELTRRVNRRFLERNIIFLRIISSRLKINYIVFAFDPVKVDRCTASLFTSWLYKFLIKGNLVNRKILLHEKFILSGIIKPLLFMQILQHSLNAVK